MNVWGWLNNPPLTQTIPVVAVSANAMPIDIERGIAAGFDDYLTKPIDMLDLHDKIDRNLRKR
ncbi:hypothetical protein Q9L42_011155 [Methylomarinum sp. Ch1-1]|uniref:Response regulatory domain-containing protein n=1 Tax=Methylomarinum roseum TaxID=3067653 RepID=A0AAU7NPQ7_9GAMM|nr:hypothetical protein [Methylomarinum sp. Ch1-1]MDP4521155.1 hypothetical protein [Methylomarinum sp. Ch1-1]